MSQTTRDKMETVTGYTTFFALPVIGLVGMASVLAAGVLAGVGLVTAVLYVLADN